MNRTSLADLCDCGHRREDHDARGCDVVVRGDGTGCRCRGFYLDTGRQKGDDDGVEYGDPRDARDA